MNLFRIRGVNILIFYRDQEIILRDVIQEDVINLFTWWIDRELNKYDPRPIPSSSYELLQECEHFCSRFDSEVMNHDPKQRKYKYFIICNTQNQMIGFVNIFSFDAECKQCELGVEIGDKRYWRKGLAQKSVQITTEYVFDNMEIERIYIETGELNIPAIRLFEKLGFATCGEIFDEGFKFITMEKIKQS
ncbi:MAG: N-acetyltransferase [Clostridia bacterium]|jgi:RimJ/RimL family protein N-acetyltransferase|nr:N-acetyltransferase [Clostridia bacterium]